MLSKQSAASWQGSHGRQGRKEPVRGLTVHGAATGTVPGSFGKGLGRTEEGLRKDVQGKAQGRPAKETGHSER